MPKQQSPIPDPPRLIELRERFRAAQRALDDFHANRAALEAENERDKKLIASTEAHHDQAHADAEQALVRGEYRPVAPLDQKFIDELTAAIADRKARLERSSMGGPNWGFDRRRHEENERDARVAYEQADREHRNACTLASASDTVALLKELAPSVVAGVIHPAIGEHVGVAVSREGSRVTFVVTVGGENG